MNSMRMQQGTKRMPTRSPLVEDEHINEEEYDDVDDVWPVRPSSSTRRYQRRADVRTETGRVTDVQSQPSRQSYVNLAGKRHTIPSRRAVSQEQGIEKETRNPSRTHGGGENTPMTGPKRIRKNWPGHRRRFHWLFFVGLVMLIMVLGWMALSALSSWWPITQDDWRYGRPRTFQMDMVVGHHDSVQNPSHFVAMNLNRHIIVIEFPGGDVSKSIAFSGPVLAGPGQDLTPVTLTFRDVNHDGKLDMIVNVQESQFVFLNENGTFVPAPPG